MADQVQINIGANATRALAAFGLVTGAAQAMANRVIGFASNMARRVFAAVPDSLRSADAMYKAAQSAGLNVETFSALAHAGDLAGISMQDLVLASRYAAQQGMALDASLIKTADEFSKMTSETDKLNLARDRYGKGSQALIPLLNQGSGAIREQMDEAKRLGLVISEEFGAGAERFNDSLTKIIGATKGIANAIAQELLPTLQAAADIINKQVQKPKDSGSWWQTIKRDSAIAALADVIQASALDDPYGTITEAQQSAFDSQRTSRIRRMNAVSGSAIDSGSETKRRSFTMPESTASSAWTSRGFLNFGEVQLANRTLSYQKTVTAYLSEIVNLQKQYLPDLANALS